MTLQSFQMKPYMLTHGEGKSIYAFGKLLAVSKRLYQKLYDKLGEEVPTVPSEGGTRFLYFGDNKKAFPIIAAQLFENTTRQINDILIADATGFMGLYKANRHFVESQVENADVVLLNKCDKVDKTKVMVTRSAISAINPEITVLMAEFGAVDWGDYHLALSAAPRSKRTRIEDEHHRINDEVKDLMAEAVSQEHPHFHEEEDALGYESYGCVFGDLSFDRGALEAFFRELNKPNSGIGEIVRAKGIFRLGDRGILMELASGEFSFQPMGQLKESKISIIGKNLNLEIIGAALERLMTKEN